MASRRPDRIASIIHKELSRLLLEDNKDPKLVPISITEIRMNPDLALARVRYVPLGGKEAPGLQTALENFARRQRGPIGRILGIRHAPELRFERDLNFEHAAHIHEILANLPTAAPDAEEEPGA